MGLLSAFGNWMLGAAAPQTGAVMREAAGVTVDDDDESGKWRRITGDSERDLTPVTQWRAQKLAVYLWERNLLANRLIELPVAYLLAEGVALVCDDPEAQAILNRHWHDPINRWSAKLVKRTRELALFGEQCWPAFVGPDGMTRIGYLDPAVIETVVVDPDNPEEAIGVVTMPDDHGRRRKYKVIFNGDDADLFTRRTQEIRAGFQDGECFLTRINQLASGRRGRSDLLAQMDWLDAYDQFMFGELDRVGFLRGFIWDVELKGATQEQCDERARKMAPPAPGSVRVHNESEVWKAQSPELGAYESNAGARLFRNHVLGGSTFPEHWFGGAENVNKSTGQDMTEPTHKMLTMRQSEIGEALVTVGRYVLRKAHAGRQLGQLTEEVLQSVKVRWPELSQRDISRYAAALQQTVSAAVQAITEGLLTRETAIALIQAMAARLGVAFDAEREIEQAQAQQGKRAEADGFVPQVPPQDEPGDA